MRKSRFVMNYDGRVAQLNEFALGSLYILLAFHSSRQKASWIIAFNRKNYDFDVQQCLLLRVYERHAFYVQTIILSLRSCSSSCAAVVSWKLNLYQADFFVFDRCRFSRKMLPQILPRKWRRPARPVPWTLRSSSTAPTLAPCTLAISEIPTAWRSATAPTSSRWASTFWPNRARPSIAASLSATWVVM